MQSEARTDNGPAIRGHCQVGSSTEAARLSNSNAGVQKRVQPWQKDQGQLIDIIANGPVWMLREDIEPLVRERLEQKPRNKEKGSNQFDVNFICQYRFRKRGPSILLIFKLI